jgi:group I intron endonuclease
MIIYKIENKINGKVYIGQTAQTLNHRIGEHLSEAKTKGVRLIGRALKKYGIESFHISIIDTAGSNDILDEKEIYWTSFHDSKIPHGYNLTDGGNGNRGYFWSEESKIKLSKSKKGKPSGRKGKPCTEETKTKLREYKGERSWMYGKHLSASAKQKLRECRIGKPLSEEHRKKLSEAHKGKPRPWLGKHRSEETKEKLRGYKGEKASFYGKTLTREHKDKISKYLTGRKLSEEHKQKLSDAKKGTHRSEETKEKIRISRLSKSNNKNIGGK